MTLFQAILLGIVQGVTEFLPISSSGHLVIIEQLFGIKQTNGLLFDIMLHFGTLFAICIVFRKDLHRLLVESIAMIKDSWTNLKTIIHNRKENDAKRCKKVVYNNYRRFVMMILISTIPTGLIGLSARELVTLSSQTLLVPGICLILTSILLLVADISESGKRVPKDISMSNAFLIGIAQGISTLPGLSRSGVTIAACLLSGFDKRFAVKYSFIMSIPAILGAILLELHGLPESQVTVSQFFIYLAATVVSGGVGYYCIRKMIGIVKRKSFKGFAAYCLVVGVLSLAGYMLLN